MSQPSLAERLGYGLKDRLLIINCDDLGVSHSANQAIQDALRSGIATSASLMVPCPEAKAAAHLLRGIPLGVHLTLTSEYQALRWRGLTNGPSLHDHNGFLPRAAQAVIENLDAADARAECFAQIEAALAWGVDVTHLDVHMDVTFKRADLFDIYLDLAVLFRLPVRVMAHDPAGYPNFPARERAAARGVLSNDYLIYPWPRPIREVLLETIPNLQPGVTEIFAHPVRDGAELRAYDEYRPDLRAADAVGVCDSLLGDALDEHRIRRIGYRDIRDLQRLEASR